jgi:hypothetical protein
MMRLFYWIELILLYWMVSASGSGFCSIDADSVGKWYISTEAKKNVPDLARIIGNTIVPLSFKRIFIPDTCSMRRYDRLAILGAIDAIRKHRSNGIAPLKIAFIGDSVGRGVFCGIGRILQGNEVTGPNENDVCGRAVPRQVPVTFSSKGKEFNVSFSPTFEMSFTYIQRFEDVVPSLKTAAATGGLYAIVFNSGAWDFLRETERARLPGPYPFNRSTTECYSPYFEAVSVTRGSALYRKAVEEVASFSAGMGVRPIYMGTHNNGRYGHFCADRHLVPLLQSAGQWEVWDTERLTRSHWREQMLDGFHFDRQHWHSTQQHLSARQKLNSGPNGHELRGDEQGELEMALAQSLLHRLFSHVDSARHHQSHVYHKPS